MALIEKIPVYHIYQVKLKYFNSSKEKLQNLTDKGDKILPMLVEAQIYNSLVLNNRNGYQIMYGKHNTW